MTLPKWAVTATIGASVAVMLIVLHFLGLIGPEPQPYWPFEPEPEPYEFFRMAAGFISGVLWTASIITAAQVLRDFLDASLKNALIAMALWVVAEVKGWMRRG